MLSDRVLLFYCQSWGQTVEEKISVLNEAVCAAGIESKFSQYEKDGKLVAGWEGEEIDNFRAIAFRKELDCEWHRGSFEAESSFIDGLIFKYKNNKENT